MNLDHAKSLLPTLAITLAAAATLGCSDQQTAGPAVGDWTNSSDGLLSIRLRAPKVTFDSAEPFVVIADIRNDSESTLNVLTPLVDDYRAISAEIVIHGPLGDAPYSGPTLEYVLSGPLFLALKPGKTVEGEVKLKVSDFGKTRAVGDYTIAYEYQVSEFDRNQAEKDGFATFWTGRLTTRPIRLRKVSPTAPTSRDRVSPEY